MARARARQKTATPQTPYPTGTSTALREQFTPLRLPILQLITLGHEAPWPYPVSRTPANSNSYNSYCKCIMLTMMQHRVTTFNVFLYIPYTLYLSRDTMSLSQLITLGHEAPWHYPVSRRSEETRVGKERKNAREK